MGRKKIEIKPITDERARLITLNKRKSGFLKKAYELSVLCGLEIGIIMFNRDNKLHEYASTSMDATLGKYAQYNAERDGRQSDTNQTILEQIRKSEKDCRKHGGQLGQGQDSPSPTPQQVLCEQQKQLEQQQGIDSANILQQQQPTRSLPWQTPTVGNFELNSSQSSGLQQLGQFGQPRQQQEQRRTQCHYNDARQIPKPDPKYSFGTGTRTEEGEGGAGADNPFVFRSGGGGMSTSGNYNLASQQYSSNCKRVGDSPGPSAPLKKFSPNPDSWLGIPESIHQYYMDQPGKSSVSSAVTYRQDQGLNNIGGWPPSSAEVSSIASATATTAPPEKGWDNRSATKSVAEWNLSKQQFQPHVAATRSNRDPYEDLLMSVRAPIREQPEDELETAIASLRDDNEELMGWLNSQPISPASSMHAI